MINKANQLITLNHLSPLNQKTRLRNNKKNILVSIYILPNCKK